MPPSLEREVSSSRPSTLAPLSRSGTPSDIVERRRTSCRLQRGCGRSDGQMKSRVFMTGAFVALLFFSSLNARAAEGDALAILANIQTRHLPYGAILDPIFTLTDSDIVAYYTRCGDSALWTGHYLAAEAFRYKVTQAPDALNNVTGAIAGLKSLADVTGTNLLARCLVPINSPYAAGIRSEESGNGVYTNSSAGWIWVGNTSRDEYS